MDLSDLIDRNAAFAPSKPAIRFGGVTLTYSDFARRIEAAAHGLKSSVGLKSHYAIARGDRIAILAANHPDYLVLLYACARLGAVMVPVNWRLAPAEVVFILRNSGAKALVVEAAFGEALAAVATELPGVAAIGIDFTPPGGRTFDELCQNGSGDGRPAGVTAADPLLIVYTSGTTGRPKGAVLRQDALIANGVMSQHCHDMTSADTILTVLPLFHVGGLNIQTTPALHLGATVELHARFAPGATLAAIDVARPTLLLTVPAVLQALIQHPAWAATRLGSLRAVSTGSTQVPQSLIDPVVARGVPVLQVYGSTETAPVAIYARLAGDWRRPGSTGLPGLLCDARVITENGEEAAPGIAGEIEIRGPNVMVEYWGDAAATAEALVDGWYKSGDIGTRDAQGYFTIHDRKKNMIISGGENIYPAEVERVLLGHPAIAEAAVIGRSDPRWQEVPVGCIVLRPGQAPTSAEIEAYCLEHLARFKVPRHYLILEALPRNAMGKVQHFALKDQVG